MKTQHKPQPFLRANEVPVEVYRQLKRDIPRLTVAELSRRGNTLCERLLNTSFPLLSAEERLLSAEERFREAVDDLGPAFIQAMALCNEHPIEHIPDSWQDSLKTRLPYHDLPVKDDPFYSLGTEQIAERYCRKYTAANRSLEVKSGIVVGNSAAPGVPT